MLLLELPVVWNEWEEVVDIRQVPDAVGAVRTGIRERGAVVWLPLRVVMRICMRIPLAMPLCLLLTL